MYCTAAACRNSQENLIRCTEDSVRAGDEMHCVCKNNCRPVSLKCLDDGTLESKNFNYYCTALPCTNIPTGLKCDNAEDVQYQDSRNCNCRNSCRPVTITCLADGIWSDFRQQCSEIYSTWEITSDNEKKVHVSYTPSTLSYLQKGTLRAQCPTNIRTTYEGTIKCNDGEINLTKPPSCDLPCRTIPAGVKCSNEEVADYVAGTTRRCTCSKSCQTVTLTCRADGHWSSPDAECQKPYENLELEISNGTKVYASYSPQTSGYPEVRCAPGIRTINPGRVNCSDRNIHVSQLPSCENNLTDTTSNNTSTHMHGDNNFLVYMGVLGCICIACITCIVHVIIMRKARNQRNQNNDTIGPVQVDEVQYDEIDLSKAVPIPDPELPPRVHEEPANVPSREVPGYLGVTEPYQYDVVGDPKPLQAWIKVGARGDGSNLDDEGYEMPVSRRNQAQSSV